MAFHMLCIQILGRRVLQMHSGQRFPPPLSRSGAVNGPREANATVLEGPSFTRPACNCYLKRAVPKTGCGKCETLDIVTVAHCRLHDGHCACAAQPAADGAESRVRRASRAGGRVQHRRAGRVHQGFARRPKLSGGRGEEQAAHEGHTVAPPRPRQRRHHAALPGATPLQRHIRLRAAQGHRRVLLASRRQDGGSGQQQHATATPASFPFPFAFAIRCVDRPNTSDTRAQRRQSNGWSKSVAIRDPLAGASYEKGCTALEHAGSQLGDEKLSPRAGSHSGCTRHAIRLDWHVRCSQRHSAWLALTGRWWCVAAPLSPTARRPDHSVQCTPPRYAGAAQRSTRTPSSQESVWAHVLPQLRESFDSLARAGVPFIPPSQVRIQCAHLLAGASIPSPPYITRVRRGNPLRLARPAGVAQLGCVSVIRAPSPTRHQLTCCCVQLRLGRVLGAGAFADVHEAQLMQTDSHTGRTTASLLVAVKNANVEVRAQSLSRLSRLVLSVWGPSLSLFLSLALP
jgi:hypothetical protein